LLSEGGGGTGGTYIWIGRKFRQKLVKVEDQRGASSGAVNTRAKARDKKHKKKKKTEKKLTQKNGVKTLPTLREALRVELIK